MIRYHLRMPSLIASSIMETVLLCTFVFGSTSKHRSRRIVLAACAYIPYRGLAIPTTALRFFRICRPRLALDLLTFGRESYGRSVWQLTAAWWATGTTTVFNAEVTLFLFSDGRGLYVLDEA